MSLLQIHEPGQTPKAHQNNEIEAIGIDLGTTNSVVAYSTDGKTTQIIRNANGNGLIPSVVSFKDDEILIGNDALFYSNHTDVITISSIKRLMGRGVKDIKKISGTLPYQIVESDNNKMVKLQIGDKQYSPIEISSLILKSIKDKAQKALGYEIQKAVITVPAYFDDSARQATKDAAKLAGLEVLRLINEPTAAAVSYGLDKKSEGVYAIYDLGGGTFDISILKMQKGIFQVLATGGSTQIGGDDFDHQIAEHFLWQYKSKANKATNLSSNEVSKLLRVSKKVKEQLSSQDKVNITYNINDCDLELSITKDELEKVIEPYVDATCEISTQVLSDADVKSSEINGVILVGGSTRVPLVNQKIAEFFDCKILDDANPDEVVAMGAAIQSHGLTKGSNNLLLDVLPLSLGLEVMGGLVEKVIPRNTPIPVSMAQEFTTYENNQSAMIIHVLQGEREVVAENRSLAQFELTNIPSLPAGVARIKVTFTVDADGLLTVSAKEEKTGKVQTVEVKPSYGLTDDEIKKMLYDAMANGKSDMEQRLLSESKVEAQRVINSIKGALQEDSDLLNIDEIEDINQTIEKTNQIIKNATRDEIVEQTKILEKSSATLAQKRMDKYVGVALKGETIDNLSS